MTETQKYRFYATVGLLLGACLVVVLVIVALKNNINLFYTPMQVANNEAPVSEKHRIRVGGMVVQDSLKRSDNLAVKFLITDYEADLWINYKGILPDLFREGQGVVALGFLENKRTFNADQILAKHDEKYMPPELSLLNKPANVATVDNNDS